MTLSFLAKTIKLPKGPENKTGMDYLAHTVTKRSVPDLVDEVVKKAPATPLGPKKTKLGKLVDKVVESVDKSKISLIAPVSPENFVTKSKDRNVVQEIGKAMDTVGWETMRFGTSSLRGAGNALGSIQEVTEGVLENTIGRGIDKLTGKPHTPQETPQIRDLTNKAATWLENESGLSDREKTYVSMAVEALGSSMPYLAGGGAAKLAKVPAFVATLGFAGLEALQNANDDYNTLREEGTPQKEALTRSLGSFGSNLTLNYVTNKLGGFFENEGLRSGIAPAVKKFLSTTFFETGQETVQQAISNITTGRAPLENLKGTFLVSLPVSALFGAGGVSANYKLAKDFKKTVGDFTVDMAESGAPIQETARVISVVTGIPEKTATEAIQRELEEDQELNAKYQEANRKAAKEIVNEATILAKAKPTELKNMEATTEEETPNPLAEEAKKYKSAEEFISSQNPIYRGQVAENFNESLLPNGVTEGAPRAAFSKNRDVAESFGKNVFERYIKPDSKILKAGDVPTSVIEAAKKPSLTGDGFEPIMDYARKNGYDAVDLGSLNTYKIWGSLPEDEIRVLNPKALMTKEQLTDIYNQATKKGRQEKDFDVSAELIAIGSDLKNGAITQEQADSKIRETLDRAKEKTDNKDNDRGSKEENRGMGKDGRGKQASDDRIRYNVNTTEGGSDGDGKWSSVQAARQLSEDAGADGGSPSMVVAEHGLSLLKTAESRRNQDSIEITEDTFKVLRLWGFSDQMVTKFEDYYDRGAVSRIKFETFSRGQTIYGAYGNDTIFLNPQERKSQALSSDRLIEHELGGHSWYDKLSQEDRIIFYDALLESQDSVIEAWKKAKTDVAFYWNDTINNVGERLEDITGSFEKSNEIMEDAGLFLPEEYSIDEMVLHSFKLKEILEKIDATLTMLGYEKTRILYNMLAVSHEHVAVMAESSDTLQVTNPILRAYFERLNEGTLNFNNETKYRSLTPLIMKKIQSSFKGFTDMTTRVLEKLKGRDTVSKQFIQDLTNSGELKQVERDLIRSVLETESDIVNVSEFADKVKSELLPLTVKSQTGTGRQVGYEFVTLKENRGDVKDYTENIYESPIKTSAGNQHFPGDTDNYFGHTRIEDMADDVTRRVIEVQSDLFQKGRLESEFDKENWSDSFGDNPNLKEFHKLRQYNNPTAHFRMVREEIKKAAEDGKTKLQFPTGETAMKIEGLGQTDRWFADAGTGSARNDFALTPNNLKVGQQVYSSGDINTGNSFWIITDVLGDGKFKAVPKSVMEDLSSDPRDWDKIIKLNKDFDLVNGKEQFDISGKIDANNPIYRFYQKDLGRYLKNSYGATEITDENGVSWYEVKVEPESANEAVLAFKVKPDSEKTPQDILDEAEANAQALGTSNAAFERSTNQDTLKTLPDGRKVVIGTYGTNAVNRKIEEGKPDRIPLSQLPESLENVVGAYKAGDSSFREGNMVLVARMPNQELRAIITRQNKNGDEEVINLFKIGRNPRQFVENLKTFGTPERIRTSNLLVRTEQLFPLRYGDTETVPSEVTSRQDDDVDNPFDAQIDRIKGLKEMALISKDYGDFIFRISNHPYLQQWRADVNPEGFQSFFRGVKKDAKIEKSAMKSISELMQVSLPQLEQSLEETSFYREFLKEQIAEHPGKALQRFVSKEGRFEDFGNPDLAKTASARKKIEERNARIVKAAERALDGTGLSFDNPDDIRSQIEQYKNLQAQYQEITEKEKAIRSDVSSRRKIQREQDRLSKQARSEGRTSGTSSGNAASRKRTDSATERTDTAMRGQGLQGIDLDALDTSYALSETEDDATVKPPTGRGGITPPELDFIKWKDKNIVRLNRETFERNVEGVAPKEDAKKVNEFLTEPVRKNETDRIKFMNDMRKELKQKYKEWNIKVGSKEDRYVQLLGEGMITVDQLSDMTPAQQDSIQKAVTYFRAKYDELLDDWNRVREEYGYSPVPKRPDYFRHFREINDIVQQFGFIFRKQDLPTEIAGMTDIFKPGKPFSTAELKRTGRDTTLSAIKGMDNYIDSISKQIYHIDSIQRAMILEKYLRQVAKASANAGNEEDRVKLPGFVSNLRDYTDRLRYKKSRIDRAAEALVGRQIYGLAQWVKNRIGANMIAANISSAFTNFIPMTQSLATTDKMPSVRGLFTGLSGPFMQNPTEIDGVESKFLVRRIGQEKQINNRFWTKASNTLGWLFEAVDSFTSRSIVAGKYYENISKGMSQEDAMMNADAYAGRVMADRSFGQTPNLFDNKSIGFITQFQLEVNNMYSFIKKDIPDIGDDEALKIVSMIFQLFLYSFLFNEGYEKVIGRRPALDPINAVLTALGLTEESQELSQNKRLSLAGTSILKNLPYSSLVLQDSRLPVSSAIPDYIAIKEGESTWSQELKKPLFNLVPPFGGSQLKKTIEGISSYAEGEVETKTGRFAFSVDEGPVSAAQMALFGKYSTPEARQYFARQEQKFDDKDTDTGIKGDIKDAYLKGDTEKVKELLKKAEEREIFPSKTSLNTFKTTVRKEKKIQDTFTDKNEKKWVSRYQKASTNEEKVKILKEMKESEGKEFFNSFADKGRKTVVSLNSGDETPILITDSVVSLYRESK